MTDQIVVFVGVSRALPDVASFVTPVFRTADGKYVRQEVEKSTIVDFVPVSIGEEFAPISFPLASQVGEDAVYSFEVSLDDFFVGGRQSLCKVLGHTLSHLKKEKVGATTWRAVERFLACSSDGVVRNRPIFRCSKISGSADHVISSYGLDDVDRLVNSVGESAQHLDHEKEMSPEEAALMLSVIPLNKEVSATLMLRYFSRVYGVTITEEQVLGQLCQGLSTPEIAVQMKLAVSTVRSHVRSLCSKTGVNGVRELANRVGALTMLAAAGGYMHEYRVSAKESHIHSVQNPAFFPSQIQREAPYQASKVQVGQVSMKHWEDSESMRASERSGARVHALSELIDSVARDTSALAEKVAYQEVQQSYDRSVAQEALQLVALSKSSKLAVAEFVKEFQLDAEAAMLAVEKSAENVANDYFVFHPTWTLKNAERRLMHVHVQMEELSSLKDLSEAVMEAKVQDIFSVGIAASVGHWGTITKMGELTRFAAHWSRSLKRLTS